MNPSPARRLSSYFVPVIAIAAAVIGIIWGWIGVTAAINGGGPVAYLLIVFGFGGVVLALALWNAAKGMKRAQR